MLRMQPGTAIRKEAARSIFLAIALTGVLSDLDVLPSIAHTESFESEKSYIVYKTVDAARSVMNRNEKKPAPVPEPAPMGTCIEYELERRIRFLGSQEDSDRWQTERRKAFSVHEASKLPFAPAPIDEVSGDEASEDSDDVSHAPPRKVQRVQGTPRTTPSKVKAKTVAAAVPLRASSVRAQYGAKSPAGPPPAMARSSSSAAAGASAGISSRTRQASPKARSRSPKVTPYSTPQSKDKAKAKAKAKAPQPVPSRGRTTTPVEVSSEEDTASEVQSPRRAERQVGERSAGMTKGEMRVAMLAALDAQSESCDLVEEMGKRNDILKEELGAAKMEATAATRARDITNQKLETKERQFGALHDKLDARNRESNEVRLNLQKARDETARLECLAADQTERHQEREQQLAAQHKEIEGKIEKGRKDLAETLRRALLQREIEREVERELHAMVPGFNQEQVRENIAREVGVREAAREAQDQTGQLRADREVRERFEEESRAQQEAARGLAAFVPDLEGSLNRATCQRGLEKIKEMAKSLTEWSHRNEHEFLGSLREHLAHAFLSALSQAALFLPILTLEFNPEAWNRWRADRASAAPRAGSVEATPSQQAGSPFAQPGAADAPAPAVAQAEDGTPSQQAGGPLAQPAEPVQDDAQQRDSSQGAQVDQGDQGRVFGPGQPGPWLRPEPPMEPVQRVLVMPSREFHVPEDAVPDRPDGEVATFFTIPVVLPQRDAPERKRMAGVLPSHGGEKKRRIQSEIDEEKKYVGDTMHSKALCMTVAPDHITYIPKMQFQLCQTQLEFGICEDHICHEQHLHFDMNGRFTMSRKQALILASSTKMGPCEFHHPKPQHYLSLLMLSNNAMNVRTDIIACLDRDLRDECFKKFVHSVTESFQKYHDGKDWYPPAEMKLQYDKKRPEIDAKAVTRRQRSELSQAKLSEVFTELAKFRITRRL